MTSHWTEVESFSTLSRSPDETRALGRALGGLLQAADVVALSGPLGAGKTVLAKGIAEGIGVNPAEVTSPTFTLVHEYAGRLRLFHVDAYRLRGARELEAIGMDEILSSEGATLIEWADRVSELLPPVRLDIAIEHVDEQSRQLTFQPHGARAGALLRAFQKRWRT